MRRDNWVNVETLGSGAWKPTEATAIELADRQPGRQVQVFVPPPDREWVPQLLNERMPLAKIARTTGLSVYRVKQLLAELGLDAPPAPAANAGGEKRPKPNKPLPTPGLGPEHFGIRARDRSKWQIGRRFGDK